MMKPIHVALRLSLLFAIVGVAVAQEPVAKESAVPEFPGPAPEHALLERFVGAWGCSHECTMEPGAEPTVSKGVTRSRMLGERWVINEIEFGDDSEKIRGVQVIGFDPKRGKYVGTWTDSMTNHLWIYEGEYDEETRTLRLDADGPSFSGDGGTQRFRDEYTFVSDDRIKSRSLVKGEDGEWTAFMTGEMRRAAE